MMERRLIKIKKIKDKVYINLINNLRKISSIVLNISHLFFALNNEREFISLK